MAKLTGLRAAPEVVRVTCHYMGFDLKIPDWTTLRSWIIRAGIGCLGDFKHFAANVLKKELESNTRFSEFTALVGRIRSSIQQTELVPLIPSSVRPKARFMNLEPQIRWAERMLWNSPEITSHYKAEAQVLKLRSCRSSCL